MRKYEEKSNPLDKFISEFYDISDPNAFVTKNSFYTDLSSWLKANKFREISEKGVTKLMIEKGFENTREYIEDYFGGNFEKKQVRVWKGLKLREELKNKTA